MADRRPTLSILMPVYNEADRLAAALEETLAVAYPFSYEVVVVDDGSTDRTPEILREFARRPEVRALRREPNAGKGAALRSGLQAVRGEFTGILDADLEYRPEDLVALVEPLQRGLANAVFGVRGFRGHTSHSYLYVLGNRLVTVAANVLFNVYLGDLMTGHEGRALGHLPVAAAA
jgi:glycosyltransferase involved in cell wall biosynthesis